MLYYDDGSLGNLRGNHAKSIEEEEDFSVYAMGTSSLNNAEQP